MKNAVIGIIFSSDKKNILIIERKDLPIWVLPGGGIDENETPEKAVIREILEETGLHVTIIRKIGEYSPINCLTAFTYVFECKQEKGELSIGEETKNIAFFPIDHFPKNFFFLHQNWIEDALLYAPDTLRKSISEITYFSVLKFFLIHPLLLIRYIISRFFKS